MARDTLPLEPRRAAENRAKPRPERSWKHKQQTWAAGENLERTSNAREALQWQRMQRTGHSSGQSPVHPATETVLEPKKDQPQSTTTAWATRGWFLLQQTSRTPHVTAAATRRTLQSLQVTPTRRAWTSPF